IIGIDCGVATGYAIWNNLRQNLDTCSLSIHQAMALVLEKHWEYDIYVRIEDARLRKWIPPEKNIKARVGRAKGAGSVSRDAQIWQHFCEDYKIPYELVPPKRNKTKLNAASFKQITGYKGSTNEHSRNAAMLCYKFVVK
ncbi:MAG: hypothetical protein ACRC2O_17525, partial [Chitinophagaceae bacterium]